MYDIYIKNYLNKDGTPIDTEQLLYSIPIRNSLNALQDSVVKTEMGKASSFEFSLHPKHLYFNCLCQMKTIMRVVYDGTTIFRGRVLTIDGTLAGGRKIHCEGDLAFLLDSQQSPTKEEARPKTPVLTYLNRLIGNHNAQMVEDGSIDKMIYLGEVPGQYSDAVFDEQRVKCDERKYGNSSWTNTMSALEALQKQFGGYFRTRYDDREGKCYLDWLDNWFNDCVNAQTVEIGKNLISLQDTAEVDNIFTALIPIGSANGDEIYIDGYRTDIHGENRRILVPQILSVFSDAELNTGFHQKADYAEAVSRYGIIYKTQKFENADTKQKLWEYATDFIKNNYIGGLTSFTVSALDLHHLIGEMDIGRYGQGNIDLNNRKPVMNQDGTVSTELSFSVNIDDQEVLLPTVINGRIVSEDAAIDHYYETGEYLGKFDTVEEAEEYAEALHERQEVYYGFQKYLSGDKMRIRYPLWNTQDMQREIIEKVIVAISATYVLHDPSKNQYSMGIPNSMISKTYGTSKSKKKGSSNGANNKKKQEDENSELASSFEGMDSTIWAHVIDAKRNSDIYQALYERWKKEGRMDVPTSVLESSWLALHKAVESGQGMAAIPTLIADGERGRLDLVDQSALAHTINNPEIMQRALYDSALYHDAKKVVTLTAAESLFSMYGESDTSDESIANALNSIEFPEGATDEEKQSIITETLSSLGIQEPPEILSAKVSKDGDSTSGLLNLVSADPLSESTLSSATNLLNSLDISGAEDKSDVGSMIKKGLDTLGVDLSGFQLDSLIDLKMKNPTGGIILETITSLIGGNKEKTTTVSTTSANGGSSKVGKDPAGNWQVELNKEIEYVDESGSTQRKKGFVYAKDFAIPEINSFKTKLAVVDQLIANRATINELEAVRASVETLEANYISASTIDAVLADIDVVRLKVLEAQRGTITNLSATTFSASGRVSLKGHEIFWTTRPVVSSIGVMAPELDMSDPFTVLDTDGNPHTGRLVFSFSPGYVRPTAINMNYLGYTG